MRRSISTLAAFCLVGAGASSLVLVSTTAARADTFGPINFEPPTYTVGSVNGQDGWSSTGAFDQGVVNTSTFAGAPGSFATQSLRISDAVTSGSFGDQTFSKRTVNAAGEGSDVDNGGFTTGTLQSRFNASFDFVSATGTGQAGSPGSPMIMSVSPDRGDGARMSYVRMENDGSQWSLFFDDYQDKPPLGSGGGGLDDGCGNPATPAPTGDDFYETAIGTYSLASAHTVRFEMQLVPGPHNDVVKVYVDGVLKITGTSWEDYFRYCAESGGGTGGPLANKTRQVDRLLFRVAGDPHPADSGNGILIDNVNVSSNNGPCTTDCFVDSASGSDFASGAAGDPLKTIQAGVNAVNPGGTVHVAGGGPAYVENVIVPKSVRITGAGNSTVVKPALSAPNPGACAGASIGCGESDVFLLRSSNVTIDHLKIDGDNTTLPGGANVGGANVDARNGIVEDFNNPPCNSFPPVGCTNLAVNNVTVQNVFLRGIYASSGGTGFDINHNTVSNVQGDAANSVGIMNDSGSGFISFNNVSNAAAAILANNSAGTTMNNNTVTLSVEGVQTDNNGDGGGSPDVLSGNNVSACTGSGNGGVFAYLPYLPVSIANNTVSVGSSRVDLQACKLEYSIVSPK